MQYDGEIHCTTEARRDINELELDLQLDPTFCYTRYKVCQIDLLKKEIANVINFQENLIGSISWSQLCN